MHNRHGVGKGCVRVGRASSWETLKRTTTPQKVLRTTCRRHEGTGGRAVAKLSGNAFAKRLLGVKDASAISIGRCPEFTVGAEPKLKQFPQALVAAAKRSDSAHARSKEICEHIM